MCGHLVLVRPEGGIKKTPGEELARIEILSSIAREGSEGRRFSVAVSGLTSFVERGCEAGVRDRAIMELMNLILGEPKYATDGTMRAIVRAMGDSDNDVRDTAECAATVLAKDFAERAFPIILDEMRDADGETSERMLTTIKSICQLATPREREKLEGILRRYEADIRRRAPPKERARKPQAPRKMPPQRLRRVA